LSCLVVLIPSSQTVRASQLAQASFGLLVVNKPLANLIKELDISEMLEAATPGVSAALQHLPHLRSLHLDNRSFFHHLFDPDRSPLALSGEAPESMRQQYKQLEDLRELSKSAFISFFSSLDELSLAAPFEQVLVSLDAVSACTILRRLSFDFFGSAEAVHGVRMRGILARCRLEKLSLYDSYRATGEVSVISGSPATSFAFLTTLELGWVEAALRTLRLFERSAPHLAKLSLAIDTTIVYNEVKSKAYSFPMLKHLRVGVDTLSFDLRWIRLFFSSPLLSLTIENPISAFECDTSTSDDIISTPSTSLPPSPPSASSTQPPSGPPTSTPTPPSALLKASSFPSPGHPICINSAVPLSTAVRRPTSCITR
jgi:hypothetical protein